MTVDLRTAPVAEVRALDLRAADRDLWADEASIWARLAGCLDRIAAADWDRQVAPSEAGGPPWSALDHAGHLAAWSDVGIAAIVRVLDGAAWPVDEDFADGDFDAFNETQRASWTGEGAAEVRTHLDESHARLLALARDLPVDVVRGDEAWSWVFMTLHGHALEHLDILERAARPATT
ncbi:MAG TPA: DinB family protein [Candidatus Limnocylindrales bacterium]|jgi:hypothetical protein